jgi:hypothetical protein
VRGLNRIAASLLLSRRRCLVAGMKVLCITVRQPAHMSLAEISFAARAIARAKFLPSVGKLGRTNWRLRSPGDWQSHSTPGTSEEGNAGPTHGVLHPANAEVMSNVHLTHLQLRPLQKFPASPLDFPF